MIKYLQFYIVLKIKKLKPASKGGKFTEEFVTCVTVVNNHKNVEPGSYQPGVTFLRYHIEDHKLRQTQVGRLLQL